MTTPDPIVEDLEPLETPTDDESTDNFVAGAFAGMAIVAGGIVIVKFGIRKVQEFRANRGKTETVVELVPSSDADES